MTEFVYIPPAEGPTLIHVDDDLIVIDKPSGLLSVPGRGEDRADCAIARLRADFPDVLLVHRLDLDTSGVMVFARTPQAQAHLGRQFEARTTRKYYQALVAGVVDGDAGQVDLPLIVDWPNRPRQMICHDTGRPAQTDWKVISRAEGQTRMRLQPLTGRSHQLRVHMLALGHPILGDTLYADGVARAHPRLMLHAWSLRLTHPRTGQGMTFSAPLPF